MWPGLRFASGGRGVSRLLLRPQAHSCSLIRAGFHTEGAPQQIIILNQLIMGTLKRDPEFWKLPNVQTSWHRGFFTIVHSALIGFSI